MKEILEDILYVLRHLNNEVKYLYSEEPLASEHEAITKKINSIANALNNLPQ